jgi:hypothetical protein
VQESTTQREASSSECVDALAATGRATRSSISARAYREDSAMERGRTKAFRPAALAFSGDQRLAFGLGVKQGLKFGLEGPRRQCWRALADGVIGRIG